MTDVDGPRSRPRWPRWLVLAAVVVMVGCALPAVLVAGVALRAGDLATVTDDPGPDGPAANGPPAGGLAGRLAAQLDRQAAALLRADRAGFLAVADRSAQPTLARRYAALRALRVTVWRAELAGPATPVAGRPGEWRQPVTFRYCLLVPDCPTSPVSAGTRWRVTGDAAVLLAVDESRSARTGARPWEVSDLAVAVGPRTMVATTPALRGRLPGLLAEAEAAARVADRFALAGPPPDHYRIFYAGPAEWRRWYGGGRPKWTAGYAVTVGGGQHEVVLNAEALPPAGPGSLLRHELTHAASLPDRGYSVRQTWWLVEGLAEYAGADDAPVNRYDGLDEVRALLPGWNGRLETLAPTGADPADRAGAAYGVGYLAVRHLVDRYGRQRVLDFFRAVVHERRPVPEAAEQVFGDPWGPLHDDCVRYVRAAAR
ncbi:hypothetical protein ACFY3U_22265 [Micromonospora sp. NPDC000089]|uniref:hypothetical protein n=1 Tax=unclassified Micromonospora TaxID=2617518 RepID=UPI0036780655